MKLRVLYHMVRADFLERLRRYSFLLTLGFAVYLAYSAATGGIVLRLDEYRGVLNSAWLGGMMTLVGSMFLTLVGFYIVKNSILRDDQTRVGQILATTPMSRTFYTLAKTISNLAVLALMMGVLALAALLLQFTRAEDPHVHLWTLLAPFVWVGLPAMAITAALAVLFETLPILRGGVGNVFYFFAWGMGLALMLNAHMDDAAGFNLIGRSMQGALRAMHPDYKEGISLTVASDVGAATKTFLWTGIDWTGAVILHRLYWVVAALAAAWVASLFFHRFDPAREIPLWNRRGRPPAPEGVGQIPAGPVYEMPHSAAGHLTAIASSPDGSRLGHLVASELRLMLKGQRWWWYAMAAGLFVACLTSPLEKARGGVLVAAWIWPVLLWSQMGTREARWATQPILFSSPKALHRQLPAVWAAGVVVALLTGSGIGIRLLLTGQWMSLAGWLAGALFIPSLALALGIWSGTSKPFEAIYTVWWYIGPAHHTPGMDFMGTSAASNTPVRFFLAALALLAVSYCGRRIRLGYV